MSKKPWSLIHGSVWAPFCRTPVKAQYFCASSAGRASPLKPSNPQLPGTVFMAPVGWVRPRFKAECVRLYFFLPFIHQKKHISRPVLLNASCFCCLVFCSYHGWPTSRKSRLVFCNKGKNRMICVDFWSSCIIIDLRAGGGGSILCYLLLAYSPARWC